MQKPKKFIFLFEYWRLRCKPTPWVPGGWRLATALHRGAQLAIGSWQLAVAVGSANEFMTEGQKRVVVPRPRNLNEQLLNLYHIRIGKDRPHGRSH